ncbi:MAG: hypothetical protein WKF83_02860 [Nocardioidaceae bacterium]
MREVFGYEPGWGLPGAPDRHEISHLMAPVADAKADAERTTSG